MITLKNMPLSHVLISNDQLNRELPVKAAS